jgi:UDP-glucose 4-epimerase
MKNIIVVTGGAGFIGSNLIEKLIKISNFKIISIDNYLSGKKINHINSKKVTYLKENTKNINNILKNYRNKINTIFHFGEFSRIYQSFIRFKDCFDSNVVGTNEVIRFALENNIKIIYSATSASLGNSGKDMNLSPYAFSKSKNLELLENLKKWFNFKCEIIYFYNVYGKRQIDKGEMATVVGIFENCFKEGKYFPVVKPGTQTRKFTHVDDTVKACILAWKNNKNSYYSIAAKKSYSIIDLARMFKGRIVYLPKRSGERFNSALINFHLNNKIHKIKADISLKKYINNFLIHNS